MLATPADFGGAAPAPRWRAPRLGEHTEEVLAELGLEPAAIDRLVEAGIAGVHEPAGDGRDPRLKAGLTDAPARPSTTTTTGEGTCVPQ